MLTNKSIIIIHANTIGACLLMRGGALAHLSQSGMLGGIEVIHSTEVIRDEYILKHTAAVVMARCWSEQHEDMARHYAKYKRRPDYGFRLLLEYDDVMWDVDGQQTVPEYNPHRLDTVASGKVLERIAPMVDNVIVSTQWIGQCWKRRFGGPEPLVVRNYLPCHLYGDRSWYRTDGDIKKPRILYGGSPYHFKEGQLGDFEGPWVEWLTKAVKDDEAELHMFGPASGWMFEPIKDKVVCHPYVSNILWPMTIRDIAPDIYIAPLQTNVFNQGKSDLKYSEACAIGAAFMGSYWDSQYCPYAEQHEKCRVVKEDTPESLREKMLWVCQRDNYNAVMEHQQEHAKSYWLESQTNLLRVLKSLMGGLIEVDYGEEKTAPDN